MPSRFNIAHLDYNLFPSVLSDKPPSEEHKQKALAAIEHMSGLGKLLRIVDIDWEGDPDAVAQGIDDANAGLQAAGDLIVMLSDLAYHEVERLDQALNRKPVDS